MKSLNEKFCFPHVWYHHLNLEKHLRSYSSDLLQRFVGEKQEQGCSQTESRANPAQVGQCPPQLSTVLQPLCRIGIAGVAITIGPIDNSLIITKIHSNRSGLRLVQKNPDKSGCREGRAECKAKPGEDWMLLGRGSESACVYVGEGCLQVRLAGASEACSCTQVSWHYFRILSFIS